MKKSLLFATALLAMGSQAKADEGMWTLYNLPEAVYQQMRAEGFELSQDRLYGAPDALSNYVVNFTGYVIATALVFYPTETGSRIVGGGCIGCCGYGISIITLKTVDFSLG